MKILMLTNREFMDTWFDCLYNGLRLDDRNTVHVYPYRDHYSLSSTPSMYEYGFPDTRLDYNTLLGQANSYELVVVGSIAQEENLDEYLQLINSCQCPIAVYHAHACAFNFNYAEFLGKPLIAEFHQETYKDDVGIFPMSHPVREEFFLPFNTEKKYDVSAIFGTKKGHPSHYKRQLLVEVIKDMFPNSIAEYESGMTYPEFRQKTSESWIAINVRGSAHQNSRYYEVPAYGAALVSEQVDTVVPHDFAPEDVSFFQFNFDNSIPERMPLYDLLDLLHQLLSDKEELCRRIESTRRCVREFHSPLAITSYFMDIICSRMKDV